MPSVPVTAMVAAPPSTSPKVTAHEPLQTALRSLWEIARTRNALSEGRPGLGRTDRFGPRTGQKLAHHGLRLAVPVGRFRRRRSEERRVGEAGGSTCRSRWSPYH